MTDWNRTITMPEKVRNFFIPTFTKEYLYLTSLTFLIFSLFNGNFPLALTFLIIPPLIFFLAIFEVCGILSIYNTVAGRSMGDTQKNIMLYYIIALNIFIAGASIFCNAYVVIGGQLKINHFVIFSYFNFLDAWLMMPLWKEGVINERTSFNDDDINTVELAAGTIAVSAIYIIGIYSLKLCWPIVFSMCIFYASRISQVFSSPFFAKASSVGLKNIITRQKKINWVLAIIVALFAAGIIRGQFG